MKVWTSKIRNLENSDPTETEYTFFYQVWTECSFSIRWYRNRTIVAMHYRGNESHYPSAFTPLIDDWSGCLSAPVTQSLPSLLHDRVIVQCCVSLYKVHVYTFVYVINFNTRTECLSTDTLVLFAIASMSDSKASGKRELEHEQKSEQKNWNLPIGHSERTSIHSQLCFRDLVIKSLKQR